MNGELLRLAVEAGFESFLTADHNLEYQQNLQALVSALAAERPNARRHPSVARFTGGKSFDAPSRVAMIESHA